MNDEFVFNKYPIYRAGLSIYSAYKNPKATINLDELSKFFSLDNGAVIVAFPGWFQHFNSHKSPIQVLLPDFGNKDEFSSEMLSKSFTKTYKSGGIDLEKTQFATELEQAFFNLSAKMLNSPGQMYWDEQYLFRFFALNAFLGQLKEKTFGKFVENNMRTLYADFNNVEGTVNNYTVTLANQYAGSVLCYFDVNLKKNQPLIDSLTLDQVKRMLTDHDFAIFATRGNYSRKLAETFALFENESDTGENISLYSASVLTGKYMDLVSKSFAKSGKNFNTIRATLRRKIASIVASVIPQEHGALHRLELQKIHEQLANADLHYSELLSFLWIMQEPKLYASNVGIKNLELLNIGLVKYGTENFVRFVNEIAQEYDLERPVFSEWIDYFDKNDELDTELHLDLLMPLIVQRHQALPPKNMWHLQKYRKFMTNLQMYKK